MNTSSQKLEALWVQITIDEFFANGGELALRNRIRDELERRGLANTGAGSGCGAMDMSFDVEDGERAKLLVDEVFAELAPGCKYSVQII